MSVPVSVHHMLLIEPVSNEILLLLLALLGPLLDAVDPLLLALALVELGLHCHIVREQHLWVIQLHVRFVVVAFVH